MQIELELAKDNFEVVPWDFISEVPDHEHDDVFLKILDRHGFAKLKKHIPLKCRYTKGRRWSNGEFEECFAAWKSKKPLTLISANLNRNPQDIIYKLLARCKAEGIEFTQKDRTQGIVKWNRKVRECAVELFENGLPAWKIAVTFQVEFEHVEKELFLKRNGYGHQKKNPFSINTDHKQFVNDAVFSNVTGECLWVLEAFAGEGRFTKIMLESERVEKIVCIEGDATTFNNLKNNIKSKRVDFICADNIEYLTGDPVHKFDVIDLDPFVTCHQQLSHVWKSLKNNAYLFVTFGGEYRRSFIGSNRKSIYGRYGFLNEAIDNKQYLEQVPFYFLGFVALKARENGYCFDVQRAVRYANNCRFWLQVNKSPHADDWFERTVSTDGHGIKFQNLNLPRFREVRFEIDQAKEQGFSK